MAASNRELDAASLTPNPQAAGGRARFGAVRTLRLLLIGSAVLPLLLGSIAGYYSYRADYHRAAVALSEAATVAEENTTKILDTHLMAAGRYGECCVCGKWIEDTKLETDPAYPICLGCERKSQS